MLSAEYMWLRVDSQGWTHTHSKPNPGLSTPSETSLRMSEQEVHAVANALFSELHIVDLNTFTATFEHDAAGVLAVLKGEACRAAADAAAVSPAPVPAADVMAMVLQIQVMRDELRTVEQEVEELRSAATSPTIARAAVAESWQRRSELPSLRAAAAAEMKAAAKEKKAAAVAMAEAAAVSEAAAAKKRAAEQLMESAEAKLHEASQKLRNARELRESVNAGFEKAAAEAAAIAAMQAERQRERVTAVQLQSELASLREAAAVVEKEVAWAERKRESAQEQITHLQIVENILREVSGLQKLSVPRSMHCGLQSFGCRRGSETRSMCGLAVVAGVGAGAVGLQLLKAEAAL